MPLYTIVNASVFGLFILLFLYYYFSPKKKKIAIVGLCGSGKTRFFHSKFKGNQHLQYTTSLKMNSGIIDDVEWIDVPGNEKIFKTCWDNIKNQVTNVYFLIDAVGFYKQRKEVAKRLDDISRDFPMKIRIILNQIHDNRALEEEKIQVLLLKELQELKKQQRKNVGVEDDFSEESMVDLYFEN